MRLLTRSDFDGLACGTILKSLGIVDSYKYVHPKDAQDGLVEVNELDILANIPYIKGCGMWFDHHSSESDRTSFDFEFKGESRLEKSAARIIYEYYGGAKVMPHFEKMIIAVDKVDSGDLSYDDILNPEGWILLGFIMDPRTGLGRFRDFTISNYSLMEKLLEICCTMQIEEILKDNDIIERIEVYFEQNNLFKDMIIEKTEIFDNVIVTDLRGVDIIYTGNRFLIYSLFKEQNISIWIVDGRNKQNVSMAVGHSILNRTSKTDVGKLMLENGGGGHFQVGTCQVDYPQCDNVLKKLVNIMNKDG